jgi:hypothetical protein
MNLPTIKQRDRRGRDRMCSWLYNYHSNAVSSNLDQGEVYIIIW